MPSFELKPMGSTNEHTVNMGNLFASGSSAMGKTVSTIDQIVWTNPKSPMPVQLAGRVPEDLWASTFDAVYRRTGEELEMQRDALNAMGGLPMIPCCVPCIVCKGFASMGKLQEKAMQSQQAWLTLVQAEQAKYQAYGVQVTLATEMRTRGGGSGSSRRMHMESVNVGLKFESTDFPMPAMGGAPVVVAAAVVAPPQAEMKRDNENSTTDELVKLADLHKAGALSDDEFTAAKARILGRI